MDNTKQIKEETSQGFSKEYYRDSYWKALEEIKVLKRACKAQADLISVLLKEQPRQ